MKAPPPVARTRRAVEEPRDDVALAVAEGGLAVALEDLLDGEAGRRFDLGVGIDEGQPQPLRQRLPTLVLPVPIEPTSAIVLDTGIDAGPGNASLKRSWRTDRLSQPNP